LINITNHINDGIPAFIPLSKKNTDYKSGRKYKQ